MLQVGTVTDTPIWRLWPQWGEPLTRPVPSTVSITSSWSEWQQRLDSQLRDFRAKRTRSLIEEIDSVLRELERWNIRISKVEAVQDYLLRFLDMIEVISRVALIAREHLPEAQLSLTLYRDPEGEDEQLVLYARLREYDEKTMERIRSARKAYRPMLADRSGWVILTTDFRQPE